jgi:predicted GNAT superfamily acetyltransferase
MHSHKQLNIHSETWGDMQYLIIDMNICVFIHKLRPRHFQAQTDKHIYIDRIVVLRKKENAGLDRLYLQINRRPKQARFDILPEKT